MAFFPTNSDGSQRGRVARLISELPAMVPFVAPEAIERLNGLEFELRLGANESAFGPSPLAVQAATRALNDVALYGDPESYELREQLADLTGRRRGEVIVGSGIDDLLGLAIRCVLDPGDAAVATTGTYPTFGYHVRGYGGMLHTVPYRDDFHIDIDRLTKLANETRARIVYVANPDNPTGTSHSQGAITELAEQLPPECTLFLDEAYHDFADAVAISYESGVPQDNQILRFRTFSKGHGLAGLRIGYMLAREEYASAFEKVRVHFGVNRIAQSAALASLGDPEHLYHVVKEVSGERDRYARIGLQMGWIPVQSSTNFIAFDVGSESAARGWVSALENRRVFVRRGSTPPVDRCIRITVGTGRQRVRLESILDGMRDGSERQLHLNQHI